MSVISDDRSLLQRTKTPDDRNNDNNADNTGNDDDGIYDDWMT